MPPFLEVQLRQKTEGGIEGEGEAAVPPWSEPLKAREEKITPGKFKANWQMTSMNLSENLFSWLSLPANSLTPPHRRKNNVVDV